MVVVVGSIPTPGSLMLHRIVVVHRSLNPSTHVRIVVKQFLRNHCCLNTPCSYLQSLLLASGFQFIRSQNRGSTGSQKTLESWQSDRMRVIANDLGTEWCPAGSNPALSVWRCHPVNQDDGFSDHSQGFESPRRYFNTFQRLRVLMALQLFQEVS